MKARDRKGITRYFNREQAKFEAQTKVAMDAARIHVTLEARKYIIKHAPELQVEYVNDIPPEQYGDPEAYIAYRNDQVAREFAKALLNNHLISVEEKGNRTRYSVRLFNDALADRLTRNGKVEKGND